MSKRAQKKETLSALAPALPPINQILIFVVGMIQAVCPLLFFTNLTRNPYYTQIALLNMGIVVVMFTWAFASLFSKEINIPSVPIAWPLYSFLGVALVSTAVSWVVHTPLRPGILYEGTRIWSFTIVNCVMAFYLPLILVRPLNTEKIKFTIWTDLILSLIWALLWIGFHSMKDPDPSLLMWDPYGALLWTLALVYVWFRTRQGQADGFVHVIFSVAVVASLYGLSQYAGRDFIWAGTVTPYGGRPVSTFGNPNFLSSYVMMTTPLAVAFMLIADKRNSKGYGIVAMLCILSTLSTLTRSSYVGLLAAFFCFAFLLKSFSADFFRKVSLGVLVVVGLILIFPKTPISGSQSPIQRFTEVFSAAKSGETYGPWHQRILIWSSAMDMAIERPLLGKGWGCFELFYPFYQGRHLFVQKFVSLRTHANNAHNILLEFLAQVGLLGTGLALWIFVAIFIFGWRQIHTELRWDKKIWLVALLSSLVGMVVDNFFGNVSIFFSMPAFLFWWIAGTMFKEAEEKKIAQPPTFRSRAILIVVMVLSLANGIYFVRRWVQEYFYFEGFKYARIDHVADSIKSLEKAFAWFPGEVNSNYELGNSYARQAKAFADQNIPDSSRNFVEKSVQAYGAAIKSNPGYDEIYFNMGVTQLQLGQEAEAIKNLETSLYINPILASAYNVLGNYYLKHEKMAEAQRIYGQATQVFPKEKDYWNNLGYTYGQLGQQEKALECFRKSFRLDPGFASAAKNLAMTAEKMGRPEPLAEVPHLINGMQADLAKHDYVSAKAKAVKLSELLPENADATLSLANIEFYMHEVESSIATYHKAMELRPDFAIAHMNLGLLYKTQQRIPEARAEFQKVLAITPTDKDAKKELDALAPH